MWKEDRMAFTILYCKRIEKQDLNTYKRNTEGESRDEIKLSYVDIPQHAAKENPHVCHNEVKNEIQRGTLDPSIKDDHHFQQHECIMNDIRSLIPERKIAGGKPVFLEYIDDYLVTYIGLLVPFHKSTAIIPDSTAREILLFAVTFHQKAYEIYEIYSMESLVLEKIDEVCNVKTRKPKLRKRVQNQANADEKTKEEKAKDEVKKVFAELKTVIDSQETSAILSTLNMLPFIPDVRSIYFFELWTLLIKLHGTLINSLKRSDADKIAVWFHQILQEVDAKFNKKTEDLANNLWDYINIYRRDNMTGDDFVKTVQREFNDAAFKLYELRKDQFTGDETMKALSWFRAQADHAFEIKYLDVRLLPFFKEKLDKFPYPFIFSSLYFTSKALLFEFTFNVQVQLTDKSFSLKKILLELEEQRQRFFKMEYELANQETSNFQNEDVVLKSAVADYLSDFDKGPRSFYTSKLFVIPETSTDIVSINENTVASLICDCCDRIIDIKSTEKE
ncbi:hypothetical protein O9G_004061 [Rozella allomycis CSF55]|uniref:Uncharacterized protein n=1 Tax=Rozella allomycis (strain CSF55) TaxID=988480 RepID=A0A075B073_ROZAC|nr:hypothetical protein O9G_004061 [Rozella allomycis CSF55]|eukprot:EPZ34184.1 hypothetical protein O9G_004061 [Rozella allomycis CSF55]